ncbi:MAG: YraN family protein [Anaerolineae bacterium]
MAFTVTDFADLTRLLAERPEWQAELRRLILSEDLLALPAIVGELAEAQRELAEAQRRTEAQVQTLAARVEELAEAQRRTEAQVQTLAARVEELAEAQRRTEQRVDGLATAVGDLQRAFGSTIEEEAESFVRALLEEKGYRLLAEHHSLALDGEVDVVMELEAPTGERVWAVVEAKARLGYRQVRGWGQRMKSAGWQQRLAAEGVPGPYLVYAYGIRVDPGAVAAAEEQGIGLMTGRGERVPPEGLIR